MTPQRFCELAQAYGADLSRWPAHERAAAQALVTAQADAQVRAALSEAESLDGWLAHHLVAPAGADLLRRVVASAPPQRAGWYQAWLWWSGLGVAGVGLVGGVSGALAMSLLLSVAFLQGGAPSADPAWEVPAVTAFDDPGADWSEE